MNGTWLAFITLLIVVVVAVSVGAQQMEAAQALKISQLEQQRNQAVDMAQEALEQRTNAYGERDGAFKVRNDAISKVAALDSQVTDLTNQVATLQDELKKVAQDRNDVQITAEAQKQEYDRLVEETNKLLAQIVDLKAKNVALQVEVASLQPGSVPFPGGQEVAGQSSRATNDAICLQVKSEDLPVQLGLGLVVLVGMAALGSGGYLYYRHDPHRKYSVHMTKEQIKDYARYQRERGNRLG